MNNLITLQEYKDFLGINTDDQNVQLSGTIAYVSQLVKEYCSSTFVDFVDDPKEEFYTVNIPSKQLYLRDFPVLSVESIEIRNNAESNYESFSNFDVDYYTSALYRTDGPAWPMGVNSVKVTYKCGYEELPAGLKLAIFNLVQYYNSEEYRPRKASGSSTMESPSSSSLRSPEFPDHIKRVLDLYKSVI